MHITIDGVHIKGRREMRLLLIHLGSPFFLPVVKPEKEPESHQLMESVVTGSGVSGSVYLGIPSKFWIEFGDGIPRNMDDIQLICEDELGNVYSQIECLVSPTPASSSTEVTFGKSNCFLVSYIPYVEGKMFLRLYAGDRTLSAFPFLVNVVCPREYSLFLGIVNKSSNAGPRLLHCLWQGHNDRDCRASSGGRSRIA